jgi:3-hydroxybutyryl-CoA dehydrogenase
MKVGVVGAGLMGAEIAFHLRARGSCGVAQRPYRREPEQAIGRLTRIYEKGVGRGFYDAEEQAALFGRIETTLDRARFGDCDFVTEAVFEREDLKAEVLGEIDRLCRPGCIIATNTSTIPISVLASYVSESRRPDFIGTPTIFPRSRA